MPSLKGKVAIVTGAAQGIGSTYAQQLASLGAVTYVADIDDAGAKASAAIIRRVRRHGARLSG